MKVPIRNHNIFINYVIIFLFEHQNTIFPWCHCHTCHPTRTGLSGLLILMWLSHHCLCFWCISFAIGLLRDIALPGHALLLSFVVGLSGIRCWVFWYTLSLLAGIEESSYSTVKFYGRLLRGVEGVAFLETFHWMHTLQHGACSFIGSMLVSLYMDGISYDAFS